MDYKWNHKIFSANEGSFSSVALGIFRFQYENNPVYKAYVQALAIDPGKIDSVYDIPFLPISFFKTHRVATTLFEPQAVFESSGTTGLATSRHYINDLGIYEESFRKGFERQYGKIKEWCVIGLLPSYLERKNSSLIYMVNKMIGESECPESGFYLDDYDGLKKILTALEMRKQKTLLIGVTFGLLDFAEQFQFPLNYTTIMETGGMKGRRKEMIREEVHQELKQAFSISTVHSEYGMTELLSQAYSKGNGIFECPSWMKVLVRDEDDPLNLQRPVNEIIQHDKKGVLNVIDLANVWSCSFIATEDAGKIFPDGSFEVQGRVDNSDIRGCNLLIS
jgi:phenylacetate-coenzyme A ligase PaaK-like adenylate-forming protein